MDTEKKNAVDQEVVEEEIPTTPEPTLEDKLSAELAETTEKYLRLMAEYDNYRKRTMKEKEGIYGEGICDTIKKLLPIADTFERAVQADCADEEYKKGVALTYQNWTAALESLGVQAFGAVGDDFDPQIHNAVMVCEDEELEKDVIAEVFQKGYRLGDRMLRVAMVKVVS